LDGKIKRTEIAAPALKLSMSMDKAHRLLGHISEETTRKTAKHLGWEIEKGTLNPCVSCTIGKAKQKNTAKGKHPMCKKNIKIRT
jgi:hypothetical protein